MLAANLVIDAAGRRTQSLTWLESMGYPKPEEERIEVGLTYATRLFQRTSEDLDGDLALIIAPTPSGHSRRME